MIEIVPYNPEWPALFKKEAALLREALGENALAIHHVGSTAVPGLCAKPKIDIIAVVHEPRPKGRGMYLRGVSTPPKFGSELPGPKGPGFGSLDENSQCGKVFSLFG